jgi:hypothetical protein
MRQGAVSDRVGRGGGGCVGYQSTWIFLEKIYYNKDHPETEMVV